MSNPFIRNLVVLVLIGLAPMQLFASESNHRSVGQRFLAWMTNCRSNASLKSECRECVRDFFADHKQPNYGMQIPHSLVDEQRAVVLVHGWNSRPEDLRELAKDVKAAGLKTSFFRYPNDQAISESSESFANALKRLGHVCPGTRFTIVTHSMGGLVARDAIENSWYGINNVDQLIMIVPPNHGSHLAKYACSTDIYEFANSKARRDEAGFLVGSILDGLSEATRDLHPSSDFLKKLNERKRNPNVQYTIVMGTDGLLDPSEMSLAKVALEKASRRCSWARCLSNKLDAKTQKYDELIDGCGDGVVATSSAQLIGVQDVIVGNFSHADILRRDGSREVQRVRAEIVSRLPR